MNMRPSPIPLRPDPAAFGRAASASFIRACAGAMVAATDPACRPAAFVTAAWPDDRDAQLMLKAAVSPATTANTATLVAVSIFAGFIASLGPVSAAAALMSRALGFEFGQGRGAILVPGVTVPSAGFVGEAAPIPVTNAAVGGPILRPSKLATITALSREMLEGTPVNLEAAVGAALRESTSGSLDAAMFSTNDVTPTTPAGILHNITPLTPSSAAFPSDALVQDLAALAGAVVRAAGGSLVFVCAPEQAISIALRAPRDVPYAVLPSAALPAGTVIALASQALAVALDPSPRIETADAPVVHMETVPAPISAVGSPNAVAAPSRNFWQTDCIALRMILQVAWGMRTANGVAFMQTVTW
jgi:hypothetical protein